jgi:hypothetical protein
MSYKDIGSAADLVRFGCSLRIGCGRCDEARSHAGVHDEH